ncbi:ABC transporter permease [Sinosporangium album]|nr:ABC transporter permease subunit [Sinosporangium album]
MFTLLSNGEFLLDIGWSLYAWALAMVLSLVIAVPLGVLIGSIPVVAKATAVPIEILRTLPSVALIPIFILVLGSDTQMKVVLTLFATVWPILFNTVYGMKDLDPVALATARSFRLPRTAVLRRVVLPSVAPFVLTGVRISAALGLIIVVGSELVAGSSAGIGAYILDASLLGTTTVVLAGSVVTGILGTAVNAGLTILDRILFAWRLKMTAADR